MQRLFRRGNVSRVKSARIAIAAGLAAVAAVSLTPAIANAADVGSNCDGSVSDGSGTKIWNNFEIRVQGVTYGYFNVGYRDHGDYYSMMFAVKDGRADGFGGEIDRGSGVGGR